MRNISRDDADKTVGEDDFVIPFGFVKNEFDEEITYLLSEEKTAKRFFDKEDILSQKTRNEILCAFEAKGEKYGYETFVDYELIYHMDDIDDVNEDLIRPDSREITELAGIIFEESIEPYGTAVGTVIDGRAVSVASENTGISETCDDLTDISVDTLEEYRGRGYGASNTALLCKLLLSRGKSVMYICDYDNTESQKIAQKVGFCFDRSELRVLWTR